MQYPGSPPPRARPAALSPSRARPRALGVAIAHAMDDLRVANSAQKYGVCRCEILLSCCFRACELEARALIVEVTVGGESKCKGLQEKGKESLGLDCVQLGMTVACYAIHRSIIVRSCRCRACSQTASSPTAPRRAPSRASLASLLGGRAFARITGGGVGLAK